jgi:hypothetical protein
LIIAITFHETAHGFVVDLLGDDTAWWLGRVSFNPANGSILNTASGKLRDALHLATQSGHDTCHGYGGNNPFRRLAMNVFAAAPRRKLNYDRGDQEETTKVKA